MKETLERLAHDLAQAWRDGTTIPLPDSKHCPATRADAYAVQDRMAALIGEGVAGWKVGATVPAVQLFEGHDGPLPGRVFASRCFDSPARIPARLFHGAKVECEFAFRLVAELPGREAPLEPAALAPLLAFHPAIELAATRYAPGTGHRSATTFDGIADNGTGGAAVLGQGVTAWQDLAFETLPIEARIDGSPPIQAYSGPYRRNPLTIMAETLADLRDRGVSIEAGTFVLTGSLTLPTPIRQGQTLVVRFADLPPLELTLV